MDTNSNEKLELLQKIKNFMYDSKFKNLGVFSKQYLSSILYSIYENNSDSLFSLAFGDFDGLRTINDKYSIPVGDQSMMNSLFLMKEILPKDTIFSRAAGDEFVFISNSLNKNDFNILIDKIVDCFNQQNSKNFDVLHGLNITMSCMDSNIYPSFTNLYNLAEMDVCRKKKETNHIDSTSKNEILHNKILSNFRSYFNYYRLNEGKNTEITLPKSYLNILTDSIIDIVIDRFEDVDSPLELYMDKLNNTLESDKVFLKYLPISKQSALNIHKCTTQDFSSSDLEAIDIKELENLFKFLVRDPLTGEFSKNYFKGYLLDKISSGPEHDISVQIFDLVHLKLSNDTVTHVKTDQKIAELFSHIISGLREKIDYSDFNHKTGNYLLSYGGKLISIENGDFSIPDTQISKILETSKANQKILDIVTARKSGSSSCLSEIMDDLSEECIYQKHDLKVNKITCKETVIPLKIALNDSISYYTDNFIEPYSINSKKSLVLDLYNGMIDVISERFPNMASNTTHYYNTTNLEPKER